MLRVLKLAALAAGMARIASARIGDSNCESHGNATQFILPSAFSAYVNNENVDLGVRLEDINGDGLVDLLQGYYANSSPETYCIWLNTGCGWIPQASYVGPLTSCLPSTALAISNVVFHFKGMTVAEFTADVSRELATTSVRVATSNGMRYSGSVLMETLAGQTDGFWVDVMGTERVHFVR